MTPTSPIIQPVGRLACRTPMRPVLRPALAVLLTAGLLAGCAARDPLARARGPVFALNAGLWHPTPAQLHTLPPVPHP